MSPTPEQVAAALAAAEEARLADEAGEEPEHIGPASISTPNLAKSTPITVRVMDSDLAALTELAAERGAAVDDLVRVAIRRYIGDDAYYEAFSRAVEAGDYAAEKLELGPAAVQRGDDD